VNHQLFVKLILNFESRERGERRRRRGMLMHGIGTSSAQTNCFVWLFRTKSERMGETKEPKKHYKEAVNMILEDNHLVNSGTSLLVSAVYVFALFFSFSYPECCPCDWLPSSSLLFARFLRVTKHLTSSDVK
jgi:hypothetical protein